MSWTGNGTPGADQVVVCSGSGDPADPDSVLALRRKEVSSGIAQELDGDADRASRHRRPDLQAVLYPSVVVVDVGACPLTDLKARPPRLDGASPSQPLPKAPRSRWFERGKASTVVPSRDSGRDEHHGALIAIHAATLPQGSPPCVRRSARGPCCRPGSIGSCRSAASPSFSHASLKVITRSRTPGPTARPNARRASTSSGPGATVGRSVGTWGKVRQCDVQVCFRDRHAIPSILSTPMNGRDVPTGGRSEAEAVVLVSCVMRSEPRATERDELLPFLLEPRVALGDLLTGDRWVEVAVRFGVRAGNDLDHAILA